MQPELTPKQQKLLNYLEQALAQTGKAPSLRKTASEMGISHTAVSQLIKALEEKGFVRRDGHYSRTIHRLNRMHKTGGMTRWMEIPIIGHIAAGLPLYAQQEWAGSVVVDSGVYGRRHMFALKIKGDSMQDAAIIDGDLVICEPRQFAENNEIVVALIHQEEATVKRFFLHKDHIELRPENSAYTPVIYKFSEILIQGKVIGVHRGPDVMEGL
jgi:repressor LexA